MSRLKEKERGFPHFWSTYAFTSHPAASQHPHLDVGALLCRKVVRAGFDHLRKGSLGHYESIGKADHRSLDNALFLSRTRVEERSNGCVRTMSL